jgi:hypothetical protein
MHTTHPRLALVFFLAGAACGGSEFRASMALEDAAAAADVDGAPSVRPSPDGRLAGDDGPGGDASPALESGESDEARGRADASVDGEARDAVADASREDLGDGSPIDSPGVFDGPLCCNAVGPPNRCGELVSGTPTGTTPIVCHSDRTCSVDPFAYGPDGGPVGVTGDVIACP